MLQDMYYIKMNTLQLNNKNLKNISIDDIDSYLEILNTGYENINTIDISGTFIRNVNFLTEWPFPEKILNISFSSCQILRLPDMTLFKNLKTVNLNFNKNITDLNYLKNNTQIAYLSASNCLINSVSSILNSRNSLKQLNLSSNKITDISVFYNYKFPVLEKLIINNNPLTDKNTLKQKISEVNKNIKIFQI